MNQVIVSIILYQEHMNPGSQRILSQFCIDEVAGKQILGIPLPSVGMLNESTLLERDK